MSRLVTDHLPLLAGAPNGVKKLRELILELAVRGKLVQQDPQDKQAQYSTKTEKHPHAETALDEKRFEIPVGWVWAKFSDVAETRLGKMLDKAKNTGELKPYLRNTNVQWYGFDLTDIKEIRLESHELSEFSVLPGDLLICEGGDPGRCSIWQDDSQEIYFQKALHRARVRQEISPEYLRLCIRADCNSGHIATLCTGATIKHLTGERLAKYVLPIPPFPEQQRIVAKVDELMALCDRLETRQSDAQAAHTRLVDELLGSLLQARDAEDFAECWGRVKESFDVLFTTEQSVDDLKRIFLSLAVTGKLSSSKELGNIGWHTGPFNDLIDPLFPIAYGVLVPGPESAGGIPFVRIADLSISNASAQPEKTISPDVDAKFSRTRLRGGEILMGVVGSIGKLGVAPDSWAGANIARAICRIVPNAKVCKAYMLWLLQSDVMQKQFIGDARTLAQPTLNVGMIRSAVASIPPLAEQYRIVEKIDEFMVLCDQIKAKMARAQALNERLAGTLVERSAS